MSEAPSWLLIDDDETFARVLARSLTRRGQRVEVAHDAERALALLAGTAFDHAVLDLNLAGDSGLRLLPRLLALQPGLPVVVLTGYASIATAVEAIKLGAVHYLAKPASASDIQAAFARREANPEQEVAEQPMSLRRISWEHLQRVLAEHDGNVSATARALGMHRRTVQRMLAKRPVRD